MRSAIPPYGGGSIGTHTNETVELLKAWAATSLAFGIFLARGNIIDIWPFLQFLVIAGVTCGVGVVVHELAHRVVARHFGASAHFLASEVVFLVLPIFLAFLGVFIAAPGAVWYTGSLTRKQGGLIALAGPVSNLVLAVLFLLLCLLVLPTGNIFLITGAMAGYKINAFLGLFNMIPVGVLDGAKVFRWDKTVFGVTIGIALVMVILDWSGTLWQVVFGR
ncbi:MAG: peptidase M50 [Chloroflexaceae bacterium]|nr:peptidase M50 [Chloroflexaceae bacterium]